LASSFGSQSNAQNSFVANVMEQIASPIKLRKIENSVLSPQAYASNSVNTSDIFGLRETMRDTDHKTIVAQQTRGKISMHKALAKN
jgi:anionic cell wall polymer biosynthesis LytR-Cps2A-Psr (LCP) family protein